jgi:hypothetical protein
LSRKRRPFGRFSARLLLREKKIYELKRFELPVIRQLLCALEDLFCVLINKA